LSKPSAKPSAETSARPKGRFRKVEVRTWGDEKFRALSALPACGQGLWLYLITGPHTGPIPGLFRAGRAGMAEELGWEIEDFDKAFQEVLQQGMVKADFKARVMWIPKAIQHNGPESPNVVRSWGAEFDLLPECDLKREAYEGLRTAVSSVGPAFLAAFDEVIRKPSPKPSDKPSVKAIANQEQEQEQEQEAGAGTAAGTGAEQGAPVAAAPRPAAAPAPAAPAPASAAASADTKSSRGTRLSKDWVLPLPWGLWAQQKYPHWTDEIVRAIASGFKNHWTEKTGRDATKITWQGTWENWCDSDITQRQYPPPRQVGAGAIAAQNQAAESRAKADRIKAAMKAAGGAVVPAATLNNTVDMPS
jgi:hypothetical protein